MRRVSALSMNLLSGLAVVHELIIWAGSRSKRCYKQVTGDWDTCRISRAHHSTLACEAQAQFNQWTSRARPIRIPTHSTLTDS